MRLALGNAAHLGRDGAEAGVEPVGEARVQLLQLRLETPVHLATLKWSVAHDQDARAPLILHEPADLGLTRVRYRKDAASGVATVAIDRQAVLNAFDFGTLNPKRMAGEIDKSDDQIERVRRLGGMVSAISHARLFRRFNRMGAS